VLRVWFSDRSTPMTCVCLFWYVVVDIRSVFFLDRGCRFCLLATWVVMDRSRGDLIWL
jgi:hypothetical protein